MRGFLCVAFLHKQAHLEKRKEITCGKSQVFERVFAILRGTGLMGHRKSDEKNENRAVKPGSARDV